MIGKLAILLSPLVSITLPTPSFSTSSMRMIACSGIYERFTPAHLRAFAENEFLDFDKAVHLALINFARVDFIDLVLAVENDFVNRDGGHDIVQKLI